MYCSVSKFERNNEATWKSAEVLFEAASLIINKNIAGANLDFDKAIDVVKQARKPSGRTLHYLAHGLMTYGVDIPSEIEEVNLTTTRTVIV